MFNLSDAIIYFLGIGRRRTGRDVRFGPNILLQKTFNCMPNNVEDFWIDVYLWRTRWKKVEYSGFRSIFETRQIRQIEAIWCARFTSFEIRNENYEMLVIAT